jgi:tRNA pseudouridine38-40 synthase
MSEDATSSTKRSAEALTASTVPAPASTSALPDSTIEETGTPAKRVKLDLEPSSDAIGAMLTDSPSVRPETSGRRGGGGAKGVKSVGKSGDRRDKHGGKRGDKAAGGNNSREAKVMREWGTRAPADGETKDEGEDINKPERLAKKKVALLIGYNGGGYSGSQMLVFFQLLLIQDDDVNIQPLGSSSNPGVSTIEGAIFDALVKAGAVSADNSDNPQKVGLSRAARTDAGVHAAVNCLSLKMILSPSLLPPGMPLPEYINSFLPPTVRVWGILRVQGSFSPRTLCDSRQYQYTLPTHVFLGPKPGCSMDIWLKKSRSKSGAAVDATLPAVEGASTEAAATVPATASATATEAAASEAIAASDAFWAAQPAESTFLDDLTAKRAWRISPGLVESARTFVKTYEGSHNYCNFTVGKDFRDRSNQRVMRKLEVSQSY